MSTDGKASRLSSDINELDCFCLKTLPRDGLLCDPIRNRGGGDMAHDMRVINYAHACLADPTEVTGRGTHTLFPTHAETRIHQQM